MSSTIRVEGQEGERDVGGRWWKRLDQSLEDQEITSRFSGGGTLKKNPKTE